MFSAAEVVEIVAFSAWQFTGPAALTSWGAESYKRDGQVVLTELPVRLAYAGAVEADEPLPPMPEPPYLSIEQLIERAERRQSPPRAWLDLLSAHPHLPRAWGSMYEMLVEGGIVERRVKQLQRVLICERFRCPVWAPENSPSLLAAGVGERERAAIRNSDYSMFSEREKAALYYAEALILFGQVEDDIFTGVQRAYSWSEIVELGFAVAAQAGPARTLASVAP